MVTRQAHAGQLNFADRATSHTWSDGAEGRIPVVMRVHSVRLQGFAAREDHLSVGRAVGTRLSRINFTNKLGSGHRDQFTREVGHSTQKA